MPQVPRPTTQGEVITDWQTKAKAALLAEWQPRERQLADPEEMWRAVGRVPDPWQLGILRGRSPQTLVLCGRQTGKSTVAASVALQVALGVPGSTTLIISRSLRQAGELKRKVDEFYHGLRSDDASYAKLGRSKARFRPVPWNVNRRLHEELDDGEAVRNSVLSMELANGSRVLAMPCTADTAVGFTIDLLIYDEAARIPDGVYSVMRPTLARARSKGKGRLIALSTPNGKRGWFWEGCKRYWDAVAAGREPEWDLVCVPAAVMEGREIKLGGCPHLSLDFLRSEWEELGSRWFLQEYCVEFVDAVDAVFSQADIERALRSAEGVQLVQEDL